MKVLKPLSELISLKGKRALITGSALGIGKAMAYRFAEAGADLELVDINERGLRAVAGELSKFEVEINIHKVNLSSKEEIAALWEKLKAKEPDILVNNAGIYPFKDFLEVDDAFSAR
jgi:short-subunit dehydrogenase